VANVLLMASGRVVRKGAAGGFLVRDSGAGANVVAFTLKSGATSGTRPFTIGQPIAKNDIPSNATLDLPGNNFQVKVKRRWNNGSVKHLIISGTWAATQNATLSVNVKPGTPPAGTDLTTADIVAANPQASYQAGAIGTVNLSSLIGSAPFRTFVQGPHMIECHYVADVGGGTELVVWFHVRCYSNGQCWVRVFCENSGLDNGSGSVAARATQTYVPTITIGGNVVYNNGGASITHYALTALMAEGWTGTDPQLTTLHDGDYLRNCKLWMNYGYRSPSAGTLNGLDQTYVPMDPGPNLPDMGGTGSDASIAIVPRCDALYVCTGDKRAFDALLCSSSSINTFAIRYRTKTARSVIKPSSFSTWNRDGPGAGGQTTSGAGANTWENNHDPSTGYSAYALTGEYWHYETMAMTAALHWLLPDNGDKGSGTSRLVEAQVRGTAWAHRTIGQYVAICPDDDLAAGQVAAEYRTILANQFTHYKAIIDAGTFMGLPFGVPWVYEYGAWDFAGTIAPWMQDFWNGVNGINSEIDALADADLPTMTSVRDFMYKFTVDRLGLAGDSTAFGFHRLASYFMIVSNNGTNNPTAWLADWGAIFTATYGAANSTLTNTLGGSSGSDPLEPWQGYWGDVHPAISYAVDHGYPGAQQAWHRLTGASNYATGAATFNNAPDWGVVPRTAVTRPSYLTSVATFTWIDAPNGNIATQAPAGVLATLSGYSSIEDVVEEWSSMWLRQESGDLGYHGGGHNGWPGNEVYAYRAPDASPLYRRILGPTPVASITTSTDTYADGAPPAMHTYYHLQWDELRDRFMQMGGQQYGNPGGGINGKVRSFNWNGGAPTDWNAAGTHPDQPSIQYGFGGGAAHPTSGNWYVWEKFQLKIWNRTSNTWTFNSGTANEERAYNAMAIDPVNNCAWSIGSSLNATSGFVQKWNLATNGCSNVAVTGNGAVAATTSAPNGICRDPVLNLFYVYCDDGVMRVFDPVALTITNVTMAGSAPGTAASYGSQSGIFGKMVFVNLLDAIYIKPAWNSPLKCFRVR
jgi:hypothetical protein